MVYNPDLFNKSPYYDDFNPDKNFQRILFRPGFAVQARELSQLQTILADQLNQLSNFTFENGSLISGGQITESQINFVRISTSISTITVDDTTGQDVLETVTDTATALADIQGNTFVPNQGSDDIRGRVEVAESTVDATNDPYFFLFFNYLTGSVALTGSEELRIVGSSGTIYRVVVKSATADTNVPVTGTAYLVRTLPGIYYVNGIFVRTAEQNTIPFNTATVTNQTEGDLTTVTIGARIFGLPSARVGFDITESLVTSEDDISLLDPASGSPNFSAPGADRYKISLTLTSKEFENENTISNTASANFVEILRFNSGNVSRREVLPDLSDLEDTLARRTFDESGNYTVEPFDLDIRDHESVFGASGVDTKLAGVVSPGRAYIRGYEFETLSPRNIEFNRARNADSETGQILDYDLGNYIIIGASAAGDTANGFSAGFSVVDTQNHALVEIAASSGATVATSRIRQVEIVNGANNQYRLYLYDIESATTGLTLSDSFLLRSEAGATLAYIDPTIGASNGAARFFRTGIEDTLVIPLPTENSIKTISGVSHEAQLTFESTVSGEEVTFTVPSIAGDPIIFQEPNLADFNVDLFLHNNSTGVYFDDFTGYSVGVNGTNTQLTVDFNTNAFDGDTIKLIANVDVAPGDSTEFNATLRTKTLNSSQTVTGITLAFDSTLGQTYADLGFADVYVLETVIGTSTAEAYTTIFDLDDGQRDNFYDHARVYLQPGATVATEDDQVDVTFRRFTHTGSYGPFTVDSYPVGTTIDGITFGYENIPSFTSEKTGTTISLRDVLDYRPIKASDGTISDAFIPTSNANFLVDYEFYLPRIDKVILDSNREFRVIEGVPSSSPAIPPDEPGAMTLFALRFGSYTFNENDVEIRYIDNKRFTMRDIAAIENRVNDIEFFSNLSFLEQEANNFTFLDDSGNIIPKTSILVDNFDGHEVANVVDDDYAVSMDFETGDLRPSFTSKQAQFVENVTSLRDKVTKNVTTVRRVQEANDIQGTGGGKSAIFTLSYNEVRAVQSLLPNDTLNPNPTGRVEWFGNLFITPESDDWYDDTIRPDVLLNREGANDAFAFKSANDDFGALGFGTQWRDWEYNWYGIDNVDREINLENELLTTRRVFDETFDGVSTAIRDEEHETLSIQRISGLAVGNLRRGIRPKSIPDSSFKTVGARSVNTVIRPFARERRIEYYAQGLKPLTTMFIFIDDVQVGEVETDTFGNVGPGSILLESGVFKAGDHLVRLIDNNTNTVATATSVAETAFTISGTFNTSRSDIVSTRKTRVRRSAVNQDSIVTDILSRTETDGSFTIGLDNLAQNFRVDRSRFSKGLFVKSVDLLFAAKSDTLPISVEIRPTINGFPHPSKIVPLSERTLNASEVNVSTTDTNINEGSQRTRFEFDIPVYLKPGEYSLVVKTNSDEYELYIGNIGDRVTVGADTATTFATGNEFVSRQPDVGVLYKPQNAGTLTPDRGKALVFGVNRCEFESSGNVTFRLDNEQELAIAGGPGGDGFKYDTYYLYSTFVDFGRTDNEKSVKFEIQTQPENRTGLAAQEFREIVPNQTIDPFFNSGQGRSQIIDADTGFTSVRTKITLSTDNNAISPIIDAERLSFVAIRNNVNESSSETSDVLDAEYNGEIDPFIPPANTRASFSRYITKTVTLDDDAQSSDIRVFLKLNQPRNTNVQVFVKVLSETDSDLFEQKSWTELDPQISLESVDNEFTDVEFKVADSSVFGEFKVYAVKIVTHTNDQFIIPRVRDMRVVTLA